MSVNWKLQLNCTCSLAISKMQTAGNSFIRGEIWVTFNYVCISLLLLGARIVKCYKKTQRAHKKRCNNSEKVRGNEILRLMFFRASHLISCYGFIKYYFTPLTINLLHFTEILSLVHMNSANACWGFLYLFTCVQTENAILEHKIVDYVKKQGKRLCLNNFRIFSYYSVKTSLLLFYFPLFVCGGVKQLRHFLCPRMDWLWTLHGPGSPMWFHGLHTSCGPSTPPLP